MSTGNSRTWRNPEDYERTMAERGAEVLRIRSDQDILKALICNKPRFPDLGEHDPGARDKDQGSP